MLNAETVSRTLGEPARGGLGLHRRQIGAAPTQDTVRWIERLGQPDLSQAQISALALMREGRQVSNGTLRQLGLDSRDATHALADLVSRGLAYRVGGRRYAEYLLIEQASGGPALFDDFGDQAPTSAALPAASAAGEGTRRRRYDRTAEIEGLFADGATLTAAQVGKMTGLGAAMTNRYLTRLVGKGRLEPTAPSRSPNRAYRVTGRS